MSKLQELLAKSKLEKDKANAASSVGKTVENSQAPQGPQKVETLPQEANSPQGGLPASGTGSGQTVAPVAPAERQLTAIEKIKLRKQNAQMAAVQSENLPAASQEIVSKVNENQSDSLSSNANLGKLLPENTTGTVLAREAQAQSLTTNKNDGTIAAEELRRNLTYLANNIEQKELVKQVVVTIAIQIKNNPALMNHMKNEDMDLMVRGMRRSYAIVARKKSEVREAKQSKSSAASELEKSFKEAGFGGFSLNLK